MQLKMYRPAGGVLPGIELKPGFTLRRMRPGEEADWSYCCLNSFGIEDVSAEHFKSRMTDETVSPENIFYACFEDKPVGTATAQVKDGEAFLHYIAVNGAYRGNGLATSLIVTVIKRHLSQGREGCYLTTDDFRIPAVKSYIRLGFLPVLWSDDARERWEKVLANCAVEHIQAFNADMTAAEDIAASL